MGGIGASLLYTQVLSAPEDESAADKYRTNASDKEVVQFDETHLSSVKLNVSFTFSDEATGRLLKEVTIERLTNHMLWAITASRKAFVFLF